MSGTLVATVVDVIAAVLVVTTPVKFVRVPLITPPVIVGAVVAKAEAT
jgi:hypothetical protein